MKTIIAKTLCLLILSFISATLWAAKSSGIIRSWSQPDGTTVKVQLLGDEHVSWYQTPDGILLVRGNDGAFYVAEVDAEGTLSTTSVLAHDLEKRTAAELSLAKSQRREAFFTAADKELLAARTRAIPGYPAAKFCPHTGTVRVPIILMQYTDKEFSLDREVVEEYFNGTARTEYSKETRFQGYSSVSQYFWDASFGKLDFKFEIYGPYTTDHEHDYYGNKTASKRIELEKEAVAKAEGDIDFAQYDSDDNGFVDMVYVLYAGTGANISGDDTDVWPACFPATQNISTQEEKTINVIGCANELAIYASGSPTGKALRAGIGVTCHEMSHGLGLPDLYNTSTPKNPETGMTDWSNCGPEDWDLMDGGENLYVAMWPCTYTAWERDIMGWIDVEELTEPTDITIYPLNDLDGRGKAYRVTNPANPLEYYIIENNISTEWNQYQNNQYGSGLMIYHINSQKNGFNMRPNETYGHPNITILPADGYIMALYNRGETIMYNGELIKMPKDDSTFRKNYFTPEMQGDPYPGSKDVTALAAYKNYTKLDGDKDMVELYPITHIQKNGDGSISFKFMDTASVLDAVTDRTTLMNGRIYSIDGRYLGTDPSVLPSGMYIQNGQKIILLTRGLQNVHSL